MGVHTGLAYCVPKHARHAEPACYATDMKLSEFEQRLEIYRQTLRSKAEQVEVEDAWHGLYAAAISLQGSSPAEASKEVAAAYSLRDARIVKNGPQTFYTMEETMDDFGKALEAFQKAIRLP